MYVHADEIKTHEQFFNFTKQFSLFKQDKFVHHIVGLKVEHTVVKNLFLQIRDIFQSRKRHFLICNDP